ncbi:MAG: homocysteine S-methyltransferase family protein [Candidatus Marinimicrobia bacterium]|nr:homocysteine S-methyltransferase family protein [Candidatus Neomarinimicrobiota bacterium]
MVKQSTYWNYLEAIARGATIILDGAMGSQLIKHGCPSPLPLWSASANLDAPETVKKTHQSYLAAGAQILTTNTFRTTARTFIKLNCGRSRARRLALTSLKKAVWAARTASAESYLVAGSIAPLEDCYCPELFPGIETARPEFAELGQDLYSAGVDLLLFETMGSLFEVRAALLATDHLELPRWVSFLIKNGRQLWNGDTLVDALELVKSHAVDLVLINCSSITHTSESLSVIKVHWSRPWGVYPNLGTGKPAIDGDITAIIPKAEIETMIIDFIDSGAAVIGTCCGSGPEHTRLISKLIAASGDVHE